MARNSAEDNAYLVNRLIDTLSNGLTSEVALFGPPCTGKSEAAFKITMKEVAAGISKCFFVYTLFNNAGSH